MSTVKLEEQQIPSLDDISEVAGNAVDAANDAKSAADKAADAAFHANEAAQGALEAVEKMPDVAGLEEDVKGLDENVSGLTEKTTDLEARIKALEESAGEGGSGTIPASDLEWNDWVRIPTELAQGNDEASSRDDGHWPMMRVDKTGNYFQLYGAFRLQCTWNQSNRAFGYIVIKVPEAIWKQYSEDVAESYYDRILVANNAVAYASDYSGKAEPIIVNVNITPHANDVNNSISFECISDISDELKSKTRIVSVYLTNAVYPLYNGKDMM